MKLPCTYYKEPSLHLEKKQHDLRIFSKVLNKGLDSKPWRNAVPLHRFACMKKSQCEEEMKKESALPWDMVDLSMLFIGLKFASGSHSQLYHGIYKDEPVALKMMRMPDEGNYQECNKLVHQYNKEVALLSRLLHPNVIKLVGAIKKPPVYCIVTEYLSAGSLRAYLHKLDHKSAPMKLWIVMALDIAKGMTYVHSQGIIHKDLKPENILINTNFQLKIADFGIACEEACCDLLCDDPGTYRWMAPEMIKRKHYDRRVDVYSFGLILWEMMNGSVPYEGMTPMQAAFALVNKNLRPKISEDCPEAMKALIERCWSVHPKKRPEFWQIVKVLQHFKTSLTNFGTLNKVPHVRFQDQRKGIFWWIQKLDPKTEFS
ncbi:hypothetical protein DM860_003551 [Cuscuta australis]|uniref:Protein kinase domain-containing protein n=1 Tax=Cuscuta australis TaxID=267555 RepID=A0A328DG78_9ASTE|nr:hypothetical protein DM860_003551 [Cuscuta australis]